LTKDRVQKAKMASLMAVNVSSAMLKGALEAANQMSDSLKPVLSEYLEKKGLKSDKPTGPKTEATINVGKQSVKAALELYIAMKEASLALMAASLDAGAEIAEHRYGAEVGAIAKDLSKTAQNALEASQNLGGVGIKSTAKKVMVESVLKVVDEDEKEVTSGESKEIIAMIPREGTDRDNEVKPPSENITASLPGREVSSAYQMD